MCWNIERSCVHQQERVGFRIGIIIDSGVSDKGTHECAWPRRAFCLLGMGWWISVCTCVLVAALFCLFRFCAVVKHRLAYCWYLLLFVMSLDPRVFCRWWLMTVWSYAIFRGGLPYQVFTMVFRIIQLLDTVWFTLNLSWYVCLSSLLLSLLSIVTTNTAIIYHSSVVMTTVYPLGSGSSSLTRGIVSVC